MTALKFRVTSVRTNPGWTAFVVSPFDLSPSASILHRIEKGIKSKMNIVSIRQGIILLPPLKFHSEEYIGHFRQSIVGEQRVALLAHKVVEVDLLAEPMSRGCKVDNS